MNNAIIATRYARSLVKYVQETGNGALVSSQARSLVRALEAVPELQRMMEAKDVVSDADKNKLLRSALGGEVSPEMGRFLSLVIGNGRAALLKDILRDFVDMYYESVGVLRVRLAVSQEPSEAFLQRIKALVAQKSGASEVIIDVDVDPSLIGGFVLDVEDYLLDASVKRQLEIIREEFIERNRRII